MSEDPLIGRQLDEYRLEELLGQGGMARVYRAQDVRLQRYVAIKVIDVPFRSEADYSQRLEREARAIAHLSHPHIVGLHRYGEVDGLLYIAMHYVPGADLQQILNGHEAKGTRMSPTEIAAVAGQIGSALDSAHARGVIHRDVKPSNILLTPEGNAVLTDFGLVLLEAVGTRGEVLGTPQYVAPEQAISSAGALPQSDLYSLGIILYRAFTGRLPFEGDDALAVAVQQMTEPPPAPRIFRPTLNPAVEAVIMKALAKEPEDRYQSGVAMAAALEEALESSGPLRAGSSPSGPDTGQVTVVQPPLRRFTPLLAGGLFLLFCLLLAGLLWWQSWDENLAGTVIEETVPPTTTHPPEEGVATQLLLKETAPVPITATAGSVALPISPDPAPLYLPLLFRSEDAGRAPTPQPPATAQTPIRSPPASPTTALAPTPAATATPEAYRLLFIRSDNNLFLVNGGDTPIPLEKVALTKMGQAELDKWPAGVLQASECVRIQKNRRREQPPPDPCRAVAGESIIFRWKDDFTVAYGAEEIARCRLKNDLERCVATLPGQ